MLIFYPLCYAAVLKNLAYYAQYYAQEQEFCSAYYYIQVGINKSLLIYIYITDDFRKTVILECFIDLYTTSFHLMTHLLEYINCFADSCHKCRNIAINEFTYFLLCLMLSVTHCAQNYAGIIDGSLSANIAKDC